MADRPSAESNGKMILSIYKEFECRPEEVLRSNSFVGWATRRRIRVDDVAQGLEYAVEQGWIRETPNGSLALTDSGFSVM